MRNRLELAKLFAEQKFSHGAEVGVFEGYFSEVLCKAIPGLQLICVDAWRWGKYQRAEDEARKRLSQYDTTIVKKLSEEAAKDVPDGSLDFVYIDAAHDHENVMKDLVAWAPKVRIGGIISGDDFYKFPRKGNTGVMTAVTEFTSDNRYNLKLTDWNEDNPIRDDRQPSWYFWRDH